MSKKLNILFIMADQLAASFLPSYGHRIVQAPNIQALGEQGVIFNSAYCASPLCAPSRFSMMAGRLPSKIGAYDNAADFPADIPTFAHVLRRAGYRTTLTGKMHFCGPDQLHGFEERLTTDIYPADYGWVPDWRHPEVRPSWYHDMLSVSRAGKCLRSNQLDFDDEVFYTARQHLYDMVRSKDERPFFLTVSFTHPHDPYAMLPKYVDRYRLEEIDLPKVPTLSPAQQDPHSRRVLFVCETDKYPPNEEEIRRARQAYYGSISYVDDRVGELLQALTDCGLRDNTLVVFTADHGDMLGERGLWYKMNFFENSCRVPLIFSLPRTIQSRRVAQSVSHLDLLPTLAEIVGIPSLDLPLDGRSLLGHLNGVKGHDYALGEYLAEGAIAPLFMIRRGKYKYIASSVDPEQLFDVAADPLELKNLADEPAHQEAMASFRREAAALWDEKAIHNSVLASQQRRRFVFEAAMQGRYHSWDYQPIKDATQLYMRNNLDLPDLEKRARFPQAI